ncbi:Predicted glycosyltransferase [Oceanicola granulosus HTCC2516]|uniref:Predicted glycosyltransferase n=1 Tax=Oceanicola granulosus (strain ATCC BAA-861 / DSM 15982 / KCTC 12143 / HTCC2516) TaxID=314256 RepID=Q2CFT4_OCEGH|nr:hypothetical protein [Oceanicola granulosus]EAR51608.1 Predicted glycosyltransferase [Oceanicola granulosus HTCC2516]
MDHATVACIKWGTLFGPEYVNRLYSGVRRHMGRPVRFLCMTEDAAGLHPEVEVLELPREPFHDEMSQALAVANRQGAMRKVSLFKPGLIPQHTGQVLGFDLDVVITGDLAPLWEMAPGRVAMRADWVEARRGRPTGHGSVFRYEPDRHRFLYEDLARDPAGEVATARGSEQRYTSTKAQARDQFAYIADDLVVSFKHDCLGLPPRNWVATARLPDNARVVCFHGHPKMDEAVAGWHGSLLRYTRPVPWLREHWIERARADLGARWA